MDAPELAEAQFDFGDMVISDLTVLKQLYSPKVTCSLTWEDMDYYCVYEEAELAKKTNKRTEIQGIES